MKTEAENSCATKQPAAASAGGSGVIGRWAGGIASLLSSAATIVCPACIPAIASFLSAMGLGFAIKPAFLNPLVLALLAISVGSLAWATTRHRRWWVLLIGSVGAGLIYISRIVVFEPAIMWIGAATLIGASALNFFVKRESCCNGRCNRNQRADEDVRP